MAAVHRMAVWRRGHSSRPPMHPALVRPDGRRRTAQHAANDLFEIRLCARERPGTGSPQLYFDGDQLTASSNGVTIQLKPRSATGRSASTDGFFARSIARRSSSSRRRMCSSVHARRGRQPQLYDVGGGEVVPAKPDFDLERHGGSVAGR